MSDVKCMVCGSEWDYWDGHIDAEKWENVLFKAGAGCPECKGIKPATGYFEPTSIDDVELGDENAQIQIDNMANVESRPAWVKPASVLLWKCAGCGVEILRDANGDLEYNKCKPGASWYHSHPYWKWTRNDDGKMDEELATPAHSFGDDKYPDKKQAVCKFCLSSCHHCGAPVSSLIATDIYDDGWCGHIEGYNQEDMFCIACVEASCSVCGRFYDDKTCTCIHCPECGHPHSKQSYKNGQNCDECHKQMPCTNDDCDGCDHASDCDQYDYCGDRNCEKCEFNKCDLGLTPVKKETTDATS